MCTRLNFEVNTSAYLSKDNSSLFRVAQMIIKVKGHNHLLTTGADDHSYLEIGHFYR